MIILISLIALCVLGGVFIRSHNEILEMVGIVLTTIVSILLVLALILLPLNQFVGKAEVERYHALKNTVEISRTSNEISDVERAAVTSEIAEYNKDLASVKYWNDTILDWWIYDGLAELDYLQ